MVTLGADTYRVTATFADDSFLEGESAAEQSVDVAADDLDVFDKDLLSLEITDLNTGKSHSSYISDLRWVCGSPLATAMFGDGKKFTLQFEGRHAGTFKLRLCGSQQVVRVMSELEHSLSRHMLAPQITDVSNYLLCPMPGEVTTTDTNTRRPRTSS